MTLSVQVLSDLHLEIDPDEGEAFVRDLPVTGDVLVLAGDVLSLRHPSRAQHTFQWFCDRFKHVLFVPGNHEYYKVLPATAETVLKDCSAALTNLSVLNPGSACIKGVRFLGCTLWFSPTPDESRYRSSMNDFRLIPGFVPWVHDTHDVHRAFLKEHLREGDVVITHHLPHPQSIAPPYIGSSLNRFFLADDATGLVERGGAQLWIHGHTHTRCDYTLGDTRVVCNPRGYPHETTGFSSAFSVNVRRMP